RQHGVAVSPRGLATVEVMAAHLTLTEPRRRFIDLPPGRVLNPAFAVAETLWILSGSDDPWIFRYNRGLAKYADDGRLQGAYGPRLRRWRDRIDQLDGVRQLLRRDPDSRQGVIQLFDPERDTKGHRDVPCTLAYRFYLRQNRLHMHTTMRSQDVWLGLPYDVFTATVLQELLAGWLEVAPGEYHHHIDSLHLYTEHLGRAADLPEHPEPSVEMPPISVGWDDFRNLVAAAIAGEPPHGAGEAWVAFAHIMASYRAWADGDVDTARTRAAAAPGALGRALERWYARLRPKTLADAS
ncbi:MAG: thymidylate synthase, partial [Gammaproteobacteria bacterium]